MKNFIIYYNNNKMPTKRAVHTDRQKQVFTQKNTACRKKSQSIKI